MGWREKSDYEPEGREFESLRAHHFSGALFEKFSFAILGPFPLEK
jgi:hypothetical protein